MAGRRAGVRPRRPHENALHRRAIAGLLEHLPGIALYGAPTVNSYKRFEPLSFAPSTAHLGARQPYGAIRSLIESPSATRLELRTGAADAEPHWAIAAPCRDRGRRSSRTDRPGRAAAGQPLRHRHPLPSTLADGIAAAREDEAIVEILGDDAVHDYTAIARSEWVRSSHGHRLGPRPVPEAI